MAESPKPTLDDLRRICHADTLPLLERGDPNVRAALEAQWRAANPPPPASLEEPPAKSKGADLADLIERHEARTEAEKEREREESLRLAQRFYDQEPDAPRFGSPTYFGIDLPKPMGIDYKSIGDKPWHQHRDLVVAIVAGCVTMAGAILLWLVAPTNRLIVLLGLVAMFCLLAFSAGLAGHYFGRLRLGVVAGILISALLIGGLGWHVWPPTPPPDWRRSDEAKQLASQMASDVQRLEDEARVIDLSDYQRAMKAYSDWVEKCSVTLGRIDNQMRKFSRETTYRYYFERNVSDMRKLLDENEKRPILGDVIHVDVLALQAVENTLAGDTSPDRDPNYPNLLNPLSH
jgi:hypothetical protein